ncbi:MAG: hypothetical protein J5716_03520, partial [Alphaproteobacteria bacterium]|nr:hypothetical protein [Alphaproteobacteria bacterium]
EGEELPVEEESEVPVEEAEELPIEEEPEASVEEEEELPIEEEPEAPAEEAEELPVEEEPEVPVEEGEELPIEEEPEVPTEEEEELPVEEEPEAPAEEEEEIPIETSVSEETASAKAISDIRSLLRLDDFATEKPLKSILVSSVPFVFGSAVHFRPGVPVTEPLAPPDNVVVSLIKENDDPYFKG